MKKLILLLLLLSLTLTGCVVYIGDSTLSLPTAPSVPEGEYLRVHFIDVGQADCALVESGGQYMLIDGGNVEDGQLVVSYLMDQGVQELAYVVCSHAHEDHVGGLPSVLAVFPTENVLSPTTTYSSGCFDDFMHDADQQDLTVQIPKPGDSFLLGGAVVTVYGPVKSYAETNDTSIVMKVVFGETSFLFTGDMETAAENDMLDYWEGKDSLHADVLKVGHHGSDTSTGYRFLYEVSPTYGVISVGTGNTYGHPHDEPMSRLNDAGVTLFRTDMLGTVIALSDGREISFTWENQSADPDNAEPANPTGQTYIGNKNSKKFHTESCGSLPKAENQVIFDSYEAAIEAGYTPCGSCLG